MTKHQRQIDALANSVLVYAINAFSEEFPNDTDEDFEFFYPMDHFIKGGEKMDNFDWATAVFDMDVKALENADIVVAVYDKHYSDSGTAWELGYAYGLGIPVLLLCTDLNADNSIMPILAATRLYDFNKFVNQEYFDVKNTLNTLK